MARASVSASGVVSGVTIFEHTADAGFDVRAPTLSDCLARAAAGMFALMYVPASSRVAGERTVQVQVESGNLVSLLHDWLEELLYQSERNLLLFREFEVWTDRRTARGWATGIPVGPATELVGPAVKAVTWHELRLEERDGRWEARVIVDV